MNAVFQDINGHTVRYTTELNLFSSCPEHVLVIIHSESGWIFTKHKKRGLEFPGGKKEKDETIEQAAIREVYEETGAHIQELNYIGQYKVEDGHDSFVKNVYFAKTDSIEKKTDYLETAGPVIMSELPADFSENQFSFIMRDQVIQLSLKQIKQLNLL